ncbi:MAG: iron-sulfur cluster assembly accessory protein [Deltaproteobacteria bacterium]|nr:iron-sulfur cluster assembly accessory protein [Deltaproteobacteria bacterium]
METYRVELTERAAQVVREAFQDQKMDLSQGYLRIGARPGGCSGYKYTMGYAAQGELTGEDQVFQSQGVQLVVNRKALEEVLGSVEVGYKEGTMMERGFTFRPLGDAKQCGCGQSFTPVKEAGAEQPAGK